MTNEFKIWLQERKTDLSLIYIEKYVDVIINRWENYTGKKAELLKTA